VKVGKNIETTANNLLASYKYKRLLAQIILEVRNTAEQ